MATVHPRPKLVASYSAERTRLCCSFVLYHFTQQKRGENLCLIEFDKRLDDVGKSEINWLQMWIKFLESSIRVSKILSRLRSIPKKIMSRNMTFSQISAPKLWHAHPCIQFYTMVAKNNSEQ